MKKILSISMVWLVLATAALGDGADVSGVFGLSPAPEGMALAVWVPLQSSESISGLAWYNNDGDTVFPELLAVAGGADAPAVLDDAVVVARDVSGATLGWSEWVFETPVASATPGLFLIFRLPVGGEFVAEGEGPGLGYRLGDGAVRCWVCSDAGDWDLLDPELQMAVSPVMNTEKGGDVLVLGQGDGCGSGVAAAVRPRVASLRAAPNPFNPQTGLRFVLPAASFVQLSIYDVRGRAVRTLVSGTFAAGEHVAVWDGRDGGGRVQPSGVYFALMKAGRIKLTQRLTLVQ